MVDIDNLEFMAMSEIEKLFPRLDVSHVPNLKNYSWEAWHEGSMGAGDYFLADEAALKLKLQPGMRVLDLGSGRGFNSCFIAKHYGVDVYAVDNSANPTDILTTAKNKGVENNIIPIKCDARNLPFPDNFFDTVLSLNAYFYFGTDDTYLPYLSRFLKPESLMCVTSPCFAYEPQRNTPEHFMFDTPDFLEFYSIHSPTWWEDHLSKYRNISLLSCEEHPQGRDIWMDSLRWQLQCRPMSDIISDMKMLLKDGKGFVTYFSMLAQIKK